MPLCTCSCRRQPIQFGHIAIRWADLGTTVDQKPHVQTSPKLSVHVTCGHGSVVLWRQCCTYFKLCGWSYIVSHNEILIQPWSLQCSELFTVTHQVAPLNCAPMGEACCHWLLLFCFLCCCHHCYVLMLRLLMVCLLWCFLCHFNYHNGSL